MKAPMLVDPMVLIVNQSGQKFTKNIATMLLDQGKAYKCFATAEELAEMREMAAKQANASAMTAATAI